jgi:hypothetical protein
VVPFLIQLGTGLGTRGPDFSVVSSFSLGLCLPLNHAEGDCANDTSHNKDGQLDMQPNVTAVEKAGGSSERLKIKFSKL